MFKRSINDSYFIDLPLSCTWGTLRMTQGNCVGVIYIGVTDVSTIDRSMLRDKISHTRTTTYYNSAWM